MGRPLAGSRRSLRWGLEPAASERPAAPQLEQPVVRYRGNSVITATPADRFSLVGIIDFPQAAIGRQQLTLELTPQRFVEEIAPARTFGFREQVDQLRAAGLIKGGGLDNALVCDGDSWLNPPLRFPDEPVRHKLLDLIGDLALVGFPQAQVLVYRGSHGLHTDLGSCFVTESPASENALNQVVLTSEQIAGLLPHRYPFALVDRVIAHEPGVSATAIKNITINEPQFQGHFPDRPADARCADCGGDGPGGRIDRDPDAGPTEGVVRLRRD